MKRTILPAIVLLLTALSIIACSSTSEPRDPYNDPDSQRTRSGQTQDEMAK